MNFERFKAKNTKQNCLERMHYCHYCLVIGRGCINPKRKEALKMAKSKKTTKKKATKKNTKKK